MATAVAGYKDDVLPPVNPKLKNGLTGTELTPPTDIVPTGLQQPATQAQPGSAAYDVSRPVGSAGSAGAASHAVTGVTPFTATSNLRGTQITAAPDPRLQTTGSQVDKLAFDLASKAQLQGPDRGQIAQDTLKQLIDSTSPDYEADLRKVNQYAAAGGRLGSGMTTTRLGDVASERNRFITEAARSLSSEAAGQTLADKLAALSGGRGVLSDLSSLEGQQFNQGLTGREELRGERSYQNDLANKSQSDLVQRLLLEDQLLNSSFNRDQRRLDSMGGYGFSGGNPSSTYMQGAGNLSSQVGGGGDTAALLYQLALQQGGR